MRLLSWNVNGLRAIWRKGFLEVLGAEKPEVCCLQETKCQPEQVAEEMRRPPGYASHWAFAERKGYSGVVTYTRLEPVAVATEFGSPTLDAEGRIVHTEFPDLHLLNVYFPNGGMGPERLAHKLRFYEEFLRLGQALRRRGKGVVVCGDVNTAHTEKDLARPRDNETVSGFLPEEREWISRFLAHGWHDTFRMFVGEPGHYTWWDPITRSRSRNVGWRLDYFFVSDELRDRVRAAGILPHVQGSDHCPVSLDIE